MMKKTVYGFKPDYAVHPGEVLKETIEARRIKKKDLAERCGLAEKTISLIVNEKASIEPSTAIQLERVLGVSASVWNNLDALYKLHKAEQAARSKLSTQIEWAKKFPVKELVRRNLIGKPVDETNAVEKLLNYFAVGSIEAWKEQFERMKVSYRSSASFQSAPEAVATWLRAGEIDAGEIETDPYSTMKFKNALMEIRSLTIESPAVYKERIRKLCRVAGVAVVFVPEFAGTHLSGATRWLNSDTALIILSLRHKKDDHFWFSFYHEAAHILFDGKKDIFIDESENLGESESEARANKMAANFLIPPKEYKTLTGKNISKREIGAFAERLSISPGIVVGRLQHEKRIPFSHFNDLKKKLDFAS